MSGKSDVESGESTIYAMMLENPQQRWSFIRKVYSITTFQLLLTIVIASIVVFIRPVANFFVSTTQGFVLCHVLFLSSFITICPLHYYHDKNPLNYFLLLISTITLALLIGLECAFISGKVILEAVILTIAVVFSLSLYTFLASRRRYDFSFLFSFLFVALSVVILSILIQVLFPIGMLSHMIHVCFASIIFCGCIVYHTDKIIKRFSYDGSTLLSVVLYLDIISLFISLVATIILEKLLIKNHKITTY